MGLYINPPGPWTPEVKLAWLAEHAQPDSASLDWQAVRDGGRLPLCYIANPQHVAIGVAYSKAEVDRFIVGTNTRPTRWYTASIEDIERECPRLREWMDEAERRGENA